MEDGWNDSAAAWIAEQGEEGDFARRCVLDRPMLARIRGRGFGSALDVGCGEGRFCRLLAAEGIRTTGIDPTAALLARARALHPDRDYREGRAEAMAVPDGSFDLVVSYLSLIDIPDIRAAIPEMVRALRPGGTLLVANLTSYNTAGPVGGWKSGAWTIDNYMDERADWLEWRGIRLQNWHRPLEVYMQLFLAEGLILRHFAEPMPHAGDPAQIARHRRVPFFVLMEWEKPG
jgi:SAM-dependent methyltransferase